MYFKYKELLEPPVKRAAYSDRTAWLMAEMSRLAYIKFEDNQDELKKGLAQANFVIEQTFNSNGTQAFLAKREADKMAVLSFRGTEKEDPRDIVTDLNVAFYKDKNGTQIHRGFYKAFKNVEESILQSVDKMKEFSLYVTGHSLGGVLALIATRVLDRDNLAACYTFGSPKVGKEEFDDIIKSPIYRIVNAFDIVPFSPPAYFIDLLLLIPSKKLQGFLKKFKGYEHHGDMRYLTFCDGDFAKVKIIPNYNEFFRLVGFWKHKKESVRHHAIDAYCEKLGQYGLKRNQQKTLIYL